MHKSFQSLFNTLSHFYASFFFLVVARLLALFFSFNNNNGQVPIYNIVKSHKRVNREQMLTIINFPSNIARQDEEIFLQNNLDSKIRNQMQSCIEYQQRDEDVQIDLNCSD